MSPVSTLSRSWVKENVLALRMPSRPTDQSLRSVSREVVGSVMNASMAVA
jgi:hypothetical protein